MGTNTFANQFLIDIGMGLYDLDADTIKVMLMRNGFSFNAANHIYKKNVKTNSGAISITFDDGGKTITRTSGDFTADGFVVGNQITTDASLNPGPFTIATVTTLVITVNETVADEGPVTKTVTSNDELATGGGYTQDDTTLAGQSFDWNTTKATMTANDVEWTASGGGIGATPGLIFYDDDVANDPIICYCLFTSPVTVSSGKKLLISDIALSIVKG